VNLGVDMETWNREDLYAEIWEQPLVKLAPKYGISAVALGKVCRKLQIPLPGRGYWVKKEFGKPVKRLPLPVAKDLPVVQRIKLPPAQGISNPPTVSPAPEPTDPEYLRIVELESRTIVLDPEAKRHKLVTTTERVLKHARPDEKGILRMPYNQPCLDLRVSKESLERSLMFVNAVILTLEAEGFPVSVKEGRHGTGAQIFGHRVSFAVVEKVREKGRREVKEYSWTRTVIEYVPSGDLEFRVGDYAYGHKYRDGKKHRLEALLPTCIGALVRDGRSSLISAALAAQRAIEEQKKAKERAELAQQITQEEKKVRDLESWVTNWARSRQMRDFIAALEKLWTEDGHDLSPEAPKGQRINWMKQQADRLDPMAPCPPSILDRKGEIGG
jgi:hypothetical protein